MTYKKFKRSSFKANIGVSYSCKFTKIYHAQQIRLYTPQIVTRSSWNWRIAWFNLLVRLFLSGKFAKHSKTKFISRNSQVHHFINFVNFEYVSHFCKQLEFIGKPNFTSQQSWSGKTKSTKLQHLLQNLFVFWQLRNIKYSIMQNLKAKTKF